MDVAATAALSEWDAEGWSAFGGSWPGRMVGGVVAGSTTPWAVTGRLQHGIFARVLASFLFRHAALWACRGTDSLRDCGGRSDRS